MGKNAKIGVPKKKISGKDFIKKILEKRQGNKKKKQKNSSKKREG